MSKYVFPAIFTQEDNGMYSVCFPDIDGCVTSGDDLEDAIAMAEDALCLMLYDLEANNNPIPEASEKEDIILREGEFVNYIACDTFEYLTKSNLK